VTEVVCVQEMSAIIADLQHCGCELAKQRYHDKKSARVAAACRFAGADGPRSAMHTTEDHIALIIVRWIMLEPSSAAIPTLWPLLDAHEQAQADRFRGAADREAYVAAHALLRATLTRVAGIAPADWRFQASESGKPTLDPAQAPPDLHFSLSHTRGLVACAVGWPYTLGVDAEAWRPAAPIELATRYFAPTEARLLAERAPAEQRSTFYRLWTLKEAYLKATGQGLAAQLDSFAFSLDPVAIAIAAPNSTTAWHFVEFRPGPAHSLALAVQSPEPIPIDAAAVSLHACLNHSDKDL
jgi:4'-phosphopantetheinyl transferase